MFSTNVVDVTTCGANIFFVETLGELVKRIRESRGWSQAMLATKAGVGPHVIWGLEKGRQNEVKPKNIEPLATALGVGVEQVISAIAFGRSKDPGAENVREVGGTVPMRALPVFRFTPASRLGGPADFYGSDFSETIDENQETIEAYAPSKRCIVIVLDGDCMEPKYAHRSKVIIDFDAVDRASGLIPGAAYFVQLRGEGQGRNTFKEFVTIEDGEYVFRCINPKYKTRMKIKPPFNAGLAVARMD